MSDGPFALQVGIACAQGVSPVVAELQIVRGEQRVHVEAELCEQHAQQGRFTLLVDDSQGLRPGPATVNVIVYDQVGSTARFSTSTQVLPSNPLSVNIAPVTNFVTGTTSLRAVKESGDVFRVRLQVTISNGEASAVTINRRSAWAFYSGGVSGTRVESGIHDWGSDVVVPARGTWRGSLTFTSPAGTGVYRAFSEKDDLTLELAVTKTSGQVAKGTLTARPMLGFGLNVIRIDASAWTEDEITDLYDAVNVAKTIFEADDMTITSVERYNIPTAQSGNFAIMDSIAEAQSLWSGWSVSSNTLLDLFVGHGTSQTFIGLSPAPGDTSKSGNSSGLWVSKLGQVVGGKKRLRVNDLGQTIAHEIGHYLGLQHNNGANNLMRPFAGVTNTNILYDQYTTMRGHGWVTIV